MMLIKRLINLSVDSIIAGVKEIIKAAEESKVEIKSGSDGGNVIVAKAQTDAIAVLGGPNSKATQGAGSKLAGVVSETDPWSMINKIKNTEATDPAELKKDSTNKAGTLAASRSNASGGGGAGANSKADLAAAVALKAMTKDGKFSAASEDEGVVKAAGVNAVNKVLGVLEEIIRQTVAKNLKKVRKAVEGIKYSQMTEAGGVTETGSIQSTAIK